MVIFLHGEDSYRSREKFNLIVEKFKKSDSSGMNIAVVDLGEKGFENFYNTAVASPFLGSKRLVIAKYGLEQKKEVQEKILNFFEDKKCPDTTTLIFYERKKADKRSKLYKFLSKQTAQEFKKLEEYKLNDWIQNEFRKRKQKIQQDAVNKLASFVGDDLWKMSNEIEKLSNFKRSGTLTARDVNLMVKARFDDNIFHLVDAIGSGNRKQTLKLVHDNLDSGAHPLYIFSMIVYQFRNMIQIKDLIERGINEYEISKLAKMHPYVVRKTISQLSRFSLGKLKNIYQRLWQADKDFKDGKVEQALGLDILVSELC